MDRGRDRVEVADRIERARTLPGEFYRDADCYRLQLERIFAPSWQDVPAAGLDAPGAIRPLTLLEGSLDEPLLLTRDGDGRVRCLSNVCTHRANLVVERACTARRLRCRYHGRRFGLDGRLLSMPEFEGVEDFPSPGDDLPRLPLERFGPLAFTALPQSAAGGAAASGREPPFERWIEPVRRRAGWMPLDELRFDPATSRSYDVRAHWALYCDNYLEGFHIPYVHEALAGELDYGAYRTETFEHGSLQVGIARDGERAFELPAEHPDAGQAVAAWYFFLFPNLMLNFYPWGLSVNVVEPQGLDRTRVRFESWVWRPELRDQGAGAELHRVELEDEAIVEAAQRGVRSRLYHRGRFSPAREQGVHHFHRLVARELAAAGWRARS